MIMRTYRVDETPWVALLNGNLILLHLKIAHHH